MDAEPQHRKPVESAADTRRREPVPRPRRRGTPPRIAHTLDIPRGGRRMMSASMIRFVTSSTASPAPMAERYATPAMSDVVCLSNGTTPQTMTFVRTG